MPLNNVVLITGASSGIGKALAETLAAEGHRLALAARRQERLETLKEDLRRRFNTDVLTIPTDLRDPAKVADMIKKTADHFGRLDVLVNNAGVLHMGPLTTMPLDKMTDLFDTNVWPLIHAIRAAVPVMEKQGGGHIVNVGSGVGRHALPFMAAYSATKFALTGLTEALRVELAPTRITFTTIYPGGVDTDMPRLLDRSALPPGYPGGVGGRADPQAVARAIARGIRRKSKEVYTPRWVRAGAWISALFPALGDALLKIHYRKALWK
jgi:short-subunit dehydrogenase